MNKEKLLSVWWNSSGKDLFNTKKQAENVFLEGQIHNSSVSSGLIRQTSHWGCKIENIYSSERAREEESTRLAIIDGFHMYKYIIGIRFYYYFILYVYMVKWVKRFSMMSTIKSISASLAIQKKIERSKSSSNVFAIYIA